MKILYVIPCLSTGGIEKLVEQWICQLKDRGHSCDILSFEDGCNNVFLKLGCNIYFCNVNILRLHYSMKSLKKFFTEHSDYDVVHSNVSFANGLICKVAKSSIKGVKIVSHAHLNGNSKFSSLISKSIHTVVYKYCQHSIFRYSDVNLCCSYASGKFLFGSNGNCRYFPNAIRTDLFRFSNETRVSYRESENLKGKFVIVHVGRFSLVKNHLFLIEAFKYVVKERPNSILILLGDGELKEEIVYKCKESGLSDKVLFYGYRNDVNNLYSMADVFVLPSLIEGFPVSLVEAQTNGLYSVTSEAVPEEAALTDLVTICPLKDGPEKWAKCIVDHGEVLNREKYCGIVSQKGFDLTTSVDQLLALYTKSEEGK